MLLYDAYKVEGNPGEVMKYHNIYIVYTKEAETADSYIERTTHELSKNYRVQVATSDRMEQLIIIGNGAMRISADAFRKEVDRTEAVMQELMAEKANGGQKLMEGKNIALLSDAGTPCISDPGFRIVRECRRAGIKVVPIPGACAFISALCASGLPSDSFLFAGFLPPKTSARKAFFEKYADFPHTLIFYESPYRIEKFADDALEVFGGERVVGFGIGIKKI